MNLGHHNKFKNLENDELDLRIGVEETNFHSPISKKNEVLVA